MTPQTAAKRSVTLVAGTSGSGKTTFALRYSLNAPVRTRFFFDGDGEFALRLKLSPARDLYELNLGLVRGWCLFDPHQLFPGRVEDAFAFYCDWVWLVCERLAGRKAVFVDEVWRHCTPTAIPPELATIVQTGRRRSVELLVTSQQPQRLHSSLLNELSEFVSFQLQHPRALEFAGSYGFDPDELRNLPQMKFVSRNLLTGGELRGKIKL